MMLTDLQWILFCTALAGIVFGWAMSLLRVLQNLDGYFAQLCLVTNLLMGLGMLLTFVYGWVNARRLGHLWVMLVWTASVILFATLGLWDHFAK